MNFIGFLVLLLSVSFDHSEFLPVHPHKVVYLHLNLIWA